jgi:hypothetical protein
MQKCTARQLITFNEKVFAFVVAGLLIRIDCNPDTDMDQAFQFNPDQIYKGIDSGSTTELKKFLSYELKVKNGTGNNL